MSAPNQEGYVSANYSRCGALLPPFNGQGMSLDFIYSLRLNPQWYAGVKHVSQYMIQKQIQNIRQIGQISRMSSQMHNQISDMQMQLFYDRQNAMDKISTGFSQYIRGVDEYLWRCNT